MVDFQTPMSGLTFHATKSTKIGLFQLFPFIPVSFPKTHFLYLYLQVCVVQYYYHLGLHFLNLLYLIANHPYKQTMSPKTGHRYPGTHMDGNRSFSPSNGDLCTLNDFAHKSPIDKSKEEELMEKIFISVNSSVCPYNSTPRDSTV